MVFELSGDYASVLSLLAAMGTATYVSLHIRRDSVSMSELRRRGNPLKLNPEWRWRLRTWLANKPELRELYAIREGLTPDSWNNVDSGSTRVAGGGASGDDGTAGPSNGRGLASIPG